MLNALTHLIFGLAKLLFGELESAGRERGDLCPEVTRKPQSLAEAAIV